MRINNNSYYTQGLDESKPTFILLASNVSNTTIDCTTISNYYELTTDNFKFVPTSITVTAFHSTDKYDNNVFPSGTATSSPEMLYNAATGTLTLTGLSVRQIRTVYEGEAGSTAVIKGNVYYRN